MLLNQKHTKKMEKSLFSMLEQNTSNMKEIEEAKLDCQSASNLLKEVSNHMKIHYKELSKEPFFKHLVPMYEKNFQEQQNRMAEICQKSEEMIQKSMQSRSKIDSQIEELGIRNQDIKEIQGNPELACGFCGKIEQIKKSFKKCSQCQLVCYCSKICQKNHWKKIHKKTCKPLQK